MSKRAAKFLSAAAAAAVAVLSWLPMSAGAAPASAECLAGPKGPAPDGGRWKYRLDRATKQKCWYVKTNDTAPTRTVAEAPPESPPPQPMAPAVADARAELSPRQTATPLSSAPPSVFPAPAAAPQTATTVKDAPNWGQSSRWPGQTTQEAAAEPEPSVQVAEASPAETAASSEPAAPPVAAATSPRQETGSVGMLVGVVAAALAFAGLAAGTVVKFGRPKPARARGEGFFDAPRPLHTDEADEPHYDNEPAAAPPPMDWIRVARERHKAEQAGEEIEQLLARAPRQTT